MLNLHLLGEYSLYKSYLKIYDWMDRLVVSIVLSTAYFMVNKCVTKTHRSSYEAVALTSYLLLTPHNTFV